MAQLRVKLRNVSRGQRVGITVFACETGLKDDGTVYFTLFFIILCLDVTRIGLRQKINQNYFYFYNSM